jgi:rhodanese-related sulfurtransferase
MAVVDQRGLPPGYPYRPDDETTPRELAALLAAKSDVLVLDVRTQPEYDLSRRIVVNCHHGRRSLTATFMLRAAGFTGVTSLAGGIDLWSRDIDRSMPTY